MKLLNPNREGTGLSDFHRNWLIRLGERVMLQDRNKFSDWRDRYIGFGLTLGLAFFALLGVMGFALTGNLGYIGVGILLGVALGVAIGEILYQRM